MVTVHAQIPEKFDRSYYTWPEKSGELKVRLYGNNSVNETVAVLLLPHSNEPLGSALLPYLEGLSFKVGKNIVLIDNIDPPFNKDSYFSLPTNFKDYLLNFYLPQINEQVEFNYTISPSTKVQKRAFHIYKCLDEFQVKKIMMVHNDTFSSIAYMYANEVNAKTESVVSSFNDQCDFSDNMEFVGYADRISNYTRKYFSPIKISDIKESESAGIFLANKLNAEVLTLECPMFDWSNISLAEKNKLASLFHKFWKREFNREDRKQYYDSRYGKLGQNIEMIPAAMLAWLQYEFLMSFMES